MIRAENPDTATRLAELRARGAQHTHPVRLAQVEALARRAGQHQGEPRARLDARLQQWLADFPAAQEAGPTPPRDAPRGPLGALVAQLAQAAQVVPAGDIAPAASAAGPSGPMALKAVRQHRETWARLLLEQRLTQALATVPDKAGPLNTQRLVHQALSVLRDTSPAYLQRFMTQVEALLWLDQARLVPPPPPRRKRGG